MILRSIANVSFDEVRDRRFNASLFAAGFEERCVAVARRLTPSNLGHIGVSGFAEHDAVEFRIEANSFFDDLTPAYFEKNGVRDYEFVGKFINRAISSKGEKHILIDYSSMPRTWYGAVLNYLRALKRDSSVIVDFCYVPGLHGETLPVTEVRGISTVPGFEGVSSGSGRTASVFSLGFEKWTPYAALERIQPNEIACLIAEPGADSNYTGRARKINEGFFSEHNVRPYEFDIRDVAQTFAFLSETTAAKLDSGCDVALVGMGPKPHTLAMLLTAIRLPEAAVVHVARSEKAPRSVRALSETIVTRVIFV